MVEDDALLSIEALCTAVWLVATRELPTLTHVRIRTLLGKYLDNKWKVLADRV